MDSEVCLAEIADAVAIDSAPSAPSSQVSALVRITLLGNVRILVGVEDVTPRIKYRKGLALLAMLAAERDMMHSRDRIADFLWPNLSLAAARSNLRQVLSNLARVFESAIEAGMPVLRITSNSVGLFVGERVQLDVAMVQSACDSLHESSGLASADILAELGSGLPSTYVMGRDFLEGFELPDCPEYATWLDHQRRYFSDCVITIYEVISDQAEASGDLNIALSYAREVVRIDPLLEANQARLMRLLALTGRPKRALRQFNMFAAQLREELDVVPASDTLLLRNLIEQGLIAPMSPAMATADMADHGTAQPDLCLGSMTVLYVACTPSTGDAFERARICRQFREVIVQVLQRNGAQVSGPAGSGLFGYFAWPNAQDSGAARNALEAAREILGQFPAPQSLRIGIHTGQVIVGSRSDSPDELGECSETAYRLSLVADDGEVVACKATLHDLPCEKVSIGVWQFRGVREVVRLFRIVC